jgi:hypothetical protein
MKLILLKIEVFWKSSMKNNQKSTESYVGLKELFASMGKNPKQLEIDECITVFDKHKKRQVLAAVFLIWGFSQAFFSALAIVFIEVKALYLLALIIGVSLVIVALKDFLYEPGKNVLAVASDWNLLLSKLRNVGVVAEGMFSGNSVAGVFEVRIIRLTDEVIEAERFGKPRARARARKKLEIVHGFAKELGLEVSTLADFFANRGQVNYVTLVEKS